MLSGRCKRDWDQMEDVAAGPLLVRRDGDIHFVTMNRPDRLNAIDASMHEALFELLPRVDRDESTKVMVLTGAGRGFCSGGDMKVAAARQGGENVRTVADLTRGRVLSAGRALIDMLLTLEKPSIAMVNGPAAGLGANLALLMDVAIMADSARIGDTHTKAGLVAGDGGAVIWPLLVGPNRAKEFLMLGRLLTGAEAAGIGLISRCVPAVDLEQEVRATAAEFAAMPQYAIRATKLAINRQISFMSHMILDTSLAYEHLSQRLPDREGAVAAFVEGRSDR
jgi:enoyl-CoA hydratase